MKGQTAGTAGTPRSDGTAGTGRFAETIGATTNEPDLQVLHVARFASQN